MKQLPLNLPLNPGASLDNFYFGERNALVGQAIRQFLHSDEFLLYLYGASGEGKTHLLEAIQNRQGNKQIQYLPLKDLVQYPADDIIDGLEQMDLVGIDDIDVIAARPDWQTALFHLFNRLKDRNKKLLVTACCSPRELPLSLPDLTSRLQWGHVLKVNSLDDSEKAEALKARADQYGLHLGDEVVRFLLERTGRSNKALFADLKTLNTCSLVEKRKLTIPFVKEVLGI